MNKEELIEYKKKLSRLSENEKKERDLYLKKIASSEIQGPQTGYPSIDKPSINYYRSEPIKEINTSQTMYNMIFDQDNMDADALQFMNNVWTFRKLKEEADKCASALEKIGVRQGDVILLGVANSLEVISTILAINKLGAVSKFFDLRASEHDIKEYANISNCKYMISHDLIIPKVANIFDETKLNKVIVINSLNMAEKFNDINPNFIEYCDFIKIGEVNEKKCVEFDSNRPSIMIQSSGTTGKPKTIIHSDSSITNMTKSFSYMDTPLGNNKTVLSALPPWIAYGIIDSMITPLALGSKVILSPNFEPDAIYNQIGNFTMVFAAPFHYRYISEHYGELSSESKEQLSNVECMVTGGDKISIEENKKFEELFGTSLTNGYGNNEGLGCLTLNPKNYNKYGTVGIAKFGEVLISYDNESKKELKYGEIGEICSLTKTPFIGYENNEEETNKCKKIHEDDSNIWLHTGDLGFIDSEGYVHLVGRAKRVIIRLGFKISAYTIEDNITSNEFVKECVAVSVKDIFEEHVPMAYVTIKDEYKNMNNIIQKIFDTCNRRLKENEVPKYIEIVDELPYTKNGKYDFKKLEELGNLYVENLNNKNKKILKK